MTLRNKQLGFTLIEMMVAMAIGLIVTAAVIGILVSVLSSNNTNLNEIRLNQELRAVMSLMTRDIRRTGYNGTSATNFASNPFSSEAGAATDTTLCVSDGANLTTCAVSDSTVMFSYDADGDGVLDNGEVYGYRLSTDTAQYCQGNATFANCATNWQALSDPSVVNITNLNFTESLVTENAGTTAESDVRQITIELSGEWVRDSSFTRTVIETVKLRNEHFSSW